jgi:hypothetical protein
MRKKKTHHNITLQKPPNPTTKGPHPHTIAIVNSEIHTSRGALRKRKEIFFELMFCVDKMRRKRKIGKKKKKKALEKVL